VRSEPWDLSGRSAVVMLHRVLRFVTFKSEPGTRVRYEFEYENPHADALEIIRRFSIEPLIVKTLHEILYADKLWWVDVFAGANQGLLLAEVELTTRTNL
jgi:adenylate cyclase